jgi:CBS domain-containing protein
MSEIALRTKMMVRDIMSSPVVTINEDETANKAAANMDMHDLGAVIVQNKAGKSIGIITERDLVIRVIAKNLKPDTVKTKEIMTTPLVTIEPEATISDAARRMNRLDIRRLGVIYKGNLVGIISSKDVLGVMPELLEIMQERSRIEGAASAEENEEVPLSVKVRNGENICDECRIELEQEK